MFVNKIYFHNKQLEWFKENDLGVKPPNNKLLLIVLAGNFLNKTKVLSGKVSQALNAGNFLENNGVKAIC